MFLPKQPKILFVIVVLSLLAGLAIGAAGAYKLAYRMKKGQRLKYRTTMQVNQSMEISGREIATTVNGANAMHLEVEDVTKDGMITFVYAIDSLTLSVKSPQIDSTFKNPQGLIGKRSRQTINARGKKLKSAVVDSINISPLLAQIGAGRQASFHFVELPSKDVKNGDSWSTALPTPPGKIAEKWW